jgi:hypothetical protein
MYMYLATLYYVSRGEVHFLFSIHHMQGQQRALRRGSTSALRLTSYPIPSHSSPTKCYLRPAASPTQHPNGTCTKIPTRRLSLCCTKRNQVQRWARRHGTTSMQVIHSVHPHRTEPHSFRRNCRRPFLLVLLVKVQQHPQHRYELLLRLLVPLLEELEQYIL